MTEKKIQTKNKFGEILIGIETRPDRILEKYPTIILVHGFGVTKEQKGMFVQLAQYYADAGFVSYRFDFSGCGESEGDFSETTLTKQKEDLESILDFVKVQPLVDISKIGIHAQSFGTCTTIALNPAVKSMILMGSLAYPKENLSKYFGINYDTYDIALIKRSDGSIQSIKPQFWIDLDQYNLPELISKTSCPILFMHAGEDETIPISEMETLFQKVRGIKEKVIIEGANHKMMPGIEKMHIVAIDWFSKNLD